MTNEQATYLIGLKKKIVVDSKPVDNVTINQEFPLKQRFEIVSEEDDEFAFIWEITQSAKNSLRINLHYQEDDSKIGLVRVDYNSGHHNPETATDNLPDMFKPYIGKWFDNESHVHYHVEGFKTLAWAIPLAKTDFSVKEIAEQGTNLQIANAIKDFAKRINVVTTININSLLI